MNLSPVPRAVLITGATGGIGGALAMAYAEPGTTLILQGRNAARLVELAARAEVKGARVLTQILDVRDHAPLKAWLEEVCVRESVDLILVAAGLNCHIGPQGKAEDGSEARALIEVNLLAAMATVEAVLPWFRRRGQGQIALFSSLAAWFGLPVTPTYCASKAAIKAYGEALRGWLGPEGIRVNVVMPGYVESQMCRDMPGPKPFLWPADRAARAIRRGLESNQARISFPFPLNFGTWWLSVLPPEVSERIVRWLGYCG